MRTLLGHVISVIPYVLLIAVGLCMHAGFEFVSVAGGSMRPALRPGDLVVARRGELPTVGDIVLVRSPERAPYLHRVARIPGGGTLILRGDANPTPDSQAVAIRHVSGTVRAVVPFGTVLDAWRKCQEGATLSAQSNISKR